MYYLKIFATLFMLLPLATFAENTDNLVTCKLGNKTYNSTQAASFEITIPELREDAQLHIYSKGKKYTITQYEIGIVPNRSRDMKGPFIKNDSNILKAMESIYHTLATGDRIFITDLQATCDGCTKPVALKSMLITIK